MKRIKWLFFLIISIVALAIAVSIFLEIPLVIDVSENTDLIESTHLTKGEILNPFKRFDFDKGNWTAYIFVSKDDELDLSVEMPKGCMFKTNNKTLLKQMQKELEFVYSGGDIATVTSYIVLCKNGRKVFDSGIVLDNDSQGLQSRQLGWIYSSKKSNLVKYCKQFKKLYFPVFLK